MEQQPQLNDHNKQEYPPMHTAEHLLNATMVKTYGCPRSRNAHIERKKSKCDYILPACPTDAEIQAIEDKVNEVISQNLPVTVEFMTHEQAKGDVYKRQLIEFDKCQYYEGNQMYFDISRSLDYMSELFGK